MDEDDDGDDGPWPCPWPWLSLVQLLVCIRMINGSSGCKGSGSGTSKGCIVGIEVGNESDDEEEGEESANAVVEVTSRRHRREPGGEGEERVAALTLVSTRGGDDSDRPFRIEGS